MYEIDTAVPPPAPQELQRDRGGASPKYPLHELMVNASFFVPYNGDDPKVVARRLSQAVREARMRANQRVPATREFVWAERTLKGKKGLRVWRTK